MRIGELVVTRTGRLRVILTVIAALAWLFVVVFSYYISHKPFALENAAALGSAMGDVVVMVALFLFACSLGQFLLRSSTFASPLEGLVFSTGLGLALISFATLASGLIGVLHPFVFWLALGLGLFLLRNQVCAVINILRALRHPAETRFERFLIVFILFSVGVAVLFSLLPPTAWDAQTYHLPIAKTAIEHGRISAPGDNPYFSYPSLVEMLFLAAMVLKGDVAAQLIHVGFLILLLAAMLAYAQRLFNARVGWLACALLVGVPSLLTVSTYAYVDLALAFFSFAAFYALMCAGQANGTRWYVLAGALAGMAMGVKYTAVIVPCAMAVLLVWRRQSSLTQCGSFAAFTALFASPWYLRNLAFTGNPIYPFVFGGPHWDNFRAAWFSRAGTGLINTPLALLTAPWDATIYGQEGTTVYDATIGPLLLALIPLLLVRVIVARAGEDQRERVQVRTLAIFSTALFVFWLVGLAQSNLLIQTRLLFPAFPVFALLGAYAFERQSTLDLPQFSLQRFTRLVIVLVLGLTAFSYGLSVARSSVLAYVVGAETRQAYLAQSLGSYYDAVQFINTKLPTDAKLLFLWEPRSYYVDRAAQPDMLDRWAHAYWQTPNVGEIVSSWRREGYTHVLFSRAGLNETLQLRSDPIDPKAVAALAELERGYLELIDDRTPLQLTSREGKPSLDAADTEPYAIYKIREAQP